MQEAGNITIEIELPEDFIAACKQYGIKPAAAIKFFAGHLSPLSYFTERIDHDGSRAADVVSNYFDKYVDNRELENREAQIGFINELLVMIEDKIDMEAYEHLIGRWYQSFFNTFN